MAFIFSFRSFVTIFGIVALPAFAIDTSAEEKACREIGFKPKTEKFASCVLELYERGDARTSARSSGAERRSVSVEAGDGSQDDQTCQNYGLKPGQPEYGSCRMQIDLARQQAAREQARYQQELAAYEQQAAELKKQQDKARAMRQLELGLRMLGGQPPLEAVNSLGTGAPVSRPAPPNTQHSIRLPNGRFVNCNTVGNITNCF